MKIIKSSLLIIVATALLITSCKSEEQLKAEKTVKDYVTYVDSLTTVAQEDLVANWDKIMADFDTKYEAATNAVEFYSNKENVTKELEEAKMKFDALGVEIKPIVSQINAVDTTANFSSSLFTQQVADDMSFLWVNKDNILSVYENFINTVEANKDNYSREQWDEIKLLYEALDSRKNTVEKEGLTSEDNLKIASLKLKFAPMYKLNRLDAKVEENVDAKE